MKSFSNQENFYKRLRELSSVDAPSKSTSLDKQTLIEYSRANDGSALGIVKEDQSYYIKSSNTKGEIAVEHFTYIGGLENKLKYKYNSLAEASKIKDFYVSALNESLDRKFNPAKTINEEEQLLSKTNADKGGIANAQVVADKKATGAAPKAENAPKAEIAKEKINGNDTGASKAQGVADSNKSDDASAKNKTFHEPSTVTGADRKDIGTAQETADTEKKGQAPKATTPSQSEIAKEKINGNDTGASKAQKVADTNKKADTGTKLKADLGDEKHFKDLATKEKAIVAETFGSEEEKSPEEPGAGQSVEAPAGAPVQGSEETADLDAAASALDALDIKADAGDAGSAEVPSAEAPAGDASGAEAGSEMPSPEAGSAGVADAGATAGAGDAGSDDAAVKDVEKLVGKTGQKIRATELTDEMVGGFLKSILAAFDGKLANLDSDLKRELSNKILKAGEEGEESNGSPVSANPVGVEDNPDAGASSASADSEVDEMAMAIPEDHEIEEAINQHLAAMGLEDEGGNGVATAAGAGSTGAVPSKGDKLALGAGAPNAAAMGNATKQASPFKSYMAERGYNPENVNEVSIMEMVSLVNGYANECDGNYAGADMQTIAEYMSPEVKEGVVESGFQRFAESVETFSVKPKKYKSLEPVMEYVDETWNFEKKDDDDTKENVKKEEKAEDKGEKEEKGEKKEKFGFAKDSQSLNKAEKESKAEEKKEEKAEKEDVSESAKAKLRAIINVKIQEQLGLKKPSLNEASKSKLSKKLDEMVSAEIKKNSDLLSKYKK